MRATLRTTWLLLSLSFLFDSICSHDSLMDPPAMQGSTSKPNSTTLLLLPISNSTNIEMMTSNATTDKGNATATMAASAAPTQPMTTNKPPLTKPQISEAPTQPPVKFPPSSTPSGGHVVSLSATTIIPSTTIIPAVSTSNSGGTAPLTGVTTGAATVKTTEAATTPSKTSKVPTNTTLVPRGSTATGTQGPPGVLTTGHIASTAGQTDTTGVTMATPQTTPHPTSSRLTGPPTNQWTTQGTTKEATTVVTINTGAGTPSAQTEKFTYDLDSEQGSPEDKVLAEVCRRLTPSWQSGTCTLILVRQNNTVKFVHVEINGQVKTTLADQLYEEITKKPTDNKTLIAILSSCGALLIMIVILAVCASHHRKPYNENQQHLTEELHTVENGYHDNPTLEVMEVQPEMQEKKLALNGEFNDSWIVPFDNLLKDDMPDEEDTHL